MSAARHGVLAAVALLAPQQGGLRSRVEGAGDARVQFAFAARADVCGMGGWVQVGTSSWYQSSGAGVSVSGDRSGCRRGPVVVRVTRAGGVLVGVDVDIAPEATPPGVTDLGAVSAAAAADYLLDLAGRAEGRPAREALLPAVLADSATVWPALSALARNRDIQRTVRSGALGWLGREMDRVGGEAARTISATLVAMASDREETLPVRQQAVSVLARTERADLGALTRMANGSDGWLRQAAVQALASSGDPRALDYLRTAFADPGLPEALRVTVIRGLGREYATGRDLELLRSRYASITSVNARQAILSVMGEQGGAANVQWLVGIAGDPATVPDLRAQAIESAQRAGAATDQLMKLYQASPDRRGKEAVINALFRNGDRNAVDQLIALARSETDATVRRSLVSRLGRLDDERVKALLKEMVGER